MRYLIVICVLFWMSFAGTVSIGDIPVGSPSSDGDYLQYDDGTAAWLTWDGMYRGVWFNTEDFLPSLWINRFDFTEFWMYHDVSYPWDVSDFYAEVWTGGSSGPEVFAHTEQLTALHYAPVYGNHNVWTGLIQEFWVIDESSLSSGGWPSLLGDATPPNYGDHSFYSDNFELWTPWSDGSLYGDYFIRAEVHFDYQALDRMTWGSIKALF